MNKKRVVAIILSISSIFLLWYLFSKKIDAELILPSPSQVLKEISNLLVLPSFWKNFASTFARCIIAFMFTIILGILLGIFSGISQFARSFFAIPLAVVRATPVVAVILVAMYWFSSSSLPVFVSVLMALPIVVTAVQEGILKIPKSLLKMSRDFSLTKFQTFRYIQLPNTIPFLRTALISSFGLTWKVIAAGEVLSLPKNGLGVLLAKSQVHLETSRVLAVAVLLVIASVICEMLLKLVLKTPIKKENKNV